MREGSEEYGSCPSKVSRPLTPSVLPSSRETLKGEQEEGVKISLRERERGGGRERDRETVEINIKILPLSLNGLSLTS